MYCPVTRLMDFYSSEIGALVQEILQKEICNIWPDVRDYRVMGCGYAVPYLDEFAKQNPERVIAMMPKAQGGRYWPHTKKNLSFFCEEENIPIESSSIDRVLLVHYMEGCSDLNSDIREIWRVLKANGRVIVIVPNRLGAWTHAEWSPFGTGRPFTTNQLNDLFCSNVFEHCSYKGALFVPPITKSKFLMRFAHLIERMGGAVLPFAAGVHIIELNKRVFAGVDKKGSGAAVLAKTREILGGEGKAVPQSYIDPN